jgi:hypothetical protein
MTKFLNATETSLGEQILHISYFDKNPPDRQLIVYLIPLKSTEVNVEYYSSEDGRHYLFVEKSLI